MLAARRRGGESGAGSARLPFLQATHRRMPCSLPRREQASGGERRGRYETVSSGFILTVVGRVWGMWSLVVRTTGATVTCSCGSMVQGAAEFMAAAESVRGHLAQLLRGLVETLEGAVTTHHRGEGLGRVRVGGVGRVGVPFVEREGAGPHRALRGDDPQRNDRKAPPVFSFLRSRRAGPVGSMCLARRCPGGNAQGRRG